MAITNGYMTLAVYKEKAEITDPVDDDRIEDYIEAASRIIDTICTDRFYVTAANESRYFTATERDYLKLPLHIASVNTLKTDEDGDRTYEITWQTTDYDLMPFNAALDGQPYKWLETTPNGSYSFPVGIKKGVEISGKFGWSSCPAQISEACWLIAHRLYKRKDTPLGVSANVATGQLQMFVSEIKSDPDVMGILVPFIRNW